MASLRPDSGCCCARELQTALACRQSAKTNCSEPTIENSRSFRLESHPARIAWAASFLGIKKIQSQMKKSNRDAQGMFFRLFCWSGVFSSLQARGKPCGWS